MKKHKSVTQEQIDFIAQHLSDMSRKELAKQVGISTGTLYQIVHELNGKIDTRYSTVRDKNVVEYVCRNYSTVNSKEIAKYLDVNITLVRNIAKQHKLKKDPSLQRSYNIIGKRFERLTVLRKIHKANCHGYEFECQCDCGNIIRSSAYMLMNGRVKSCGCYRVDMSRARKTHGASNTRLYRIWVHIRTRCSDPKDGNYKNYGGRGITVCAEWVNSFLNFQTWSLLNGYADDLEIDRIDNNGNYEPNNCRWASRMVQCNNQRRNRYVTNNERTLTVAEWARDLHISYRRMRYLVNKGKFPPKED